MLLHTLAGMRSSGRKVFLSVLFVGRKVRSRDPRCSVAALGRIKGARRGRVSERRVPTCRGIDAEQESAPPRASASAATARSAWLKSEVHAWTSFSPPQPRGACLPRMRRSRFVYGQRETAWHASIAPSRLPLAYSGLPGSSAIPTHAVSLTLCIPQRSKNPCAPEVTSVSALIWHASSPSVSSTPARRRERTMTARSCGAMCARSRRPMPASELERGSRR